MGASDSDKAKIQTDIAALQGQLRSYADSATFSGANWLAVNSTVAAGNPAAGVAADAQIVSSFNRDSTGNVTLGTIKVNIQAIKLYDAAATTNITRDCSKVFASAPRASVTTPPRRLGGTVAATDGYALSTLTVVGFNDAQVTQC